MERYTARAKVLLAAGTVCAMLLAGCATPRGQKTLTCTPGQCDAEVHVDVHLGSCTISAPDIDNTGANNMFWTIDAPSRALGYTFPDEAVQLGIWVKSPPPSGCLAPEGVFDSPQRQNDWKFKLHNKGTPGVYCYGISLVSKSAPSPCTFDPQIVNH